ncbi:MAG TPA: hypothetical protein PKW18_06990 [Candidatus Sumerlaeota bacterium]|nr:hypothetical protein [Candidatus Sumerlaeota bacterium]HON49534.1 hypothetical protein [Candidatus Sumerlaeota bacterium]HOR64685.1 hypothetical protein [Candidatus Sumerlaeota bacterium]HPL74303.1 hypothetical protein [Candidatus Sumerlaeota bacterium]HRU55435.1 hypothetical protein [Candidatus Sumerlaeia bacterium]
MKKQYSFISFFILLSVLSFAATSTVIENCDNTDYSFSYITGKTETITLTNNSTDKTEGACSLDVQYDYVDATVWNQVSIIKDLPATVDISGMEVFKYDLKVPAADSRFELHIYFEDEKGCFARLLDTDSFDVARPIFSVRSLTLSNIQKSQHYKAGRFINMKKIKKIYYRIYRAANVGNSGTFNFSIDNVRFESNTGLLNEVVIEDFESYADDASLQAAYSGAFGRTVTPTLETATPFAGAKSMTYTTDISAVYTNFGVVKTFDETLDFSQAKYYKIAVYGDAKFDVGYNPTAHLYLEDDLGRRILSLIWYWPSNAEWNQIIMPIQYDGIETWTDVSTLKYGGASGWRQDKWDADVNGNGSGWDDDCDLTKIKKIIICVETQAAAGGSVVYPLNGVTMKFDNIIVGFTTEEPPVPSVKYYNVNAISGLTKAPIIDGVVSMDEWADAAAPGCTGFVKHDLNTVAAAEDPVVKAVFDRDYLYILYQVVNNSFVVDSGFVPPPYGYRDPTSNFSGDNYEFLFAPKGIMDAFVYHISLFAKPGDKVYVWDDAGESGFNNPSAWNAVGDQGAFSYNSGTKLLTIEYKIPFSAFNLPEAPVNSFPADSTVWGVQIGYINDSPAEAVNWEPDATAGFYAGRPYGTWTFVGVPPAPLAAQNWHFFE